MARRRALGLQPLPSCLQCQVPPIQDQRRLGTSGSHDDSRLRGPGQPGRGWLRSPAGAGWGEPSCPRPKLGCGWKHPRGCGRKQSVYPLGPTTRLGRGARSTLGVAVQPRFSSAGWARLYRPRQSQERGRTENATPPSPKNDLGREVTCAPEPRCGHSQRDRGGEEQGWLLPGRGRGSGISAPLGYGRDDWSLGDPGSALCCRPPVTTAGRRPGGAPASPRRPRRPWAGGVQRRRSVSFRVPRPRRRGSPPARTCEGPPCPSEAPPRPAARAPGAAEEPSSGSRSRSRRSGPGLAPHLRPTPPGPAGACGRCVGGAASGASGRGRRGGGNTGNPGAGRVSEVQESRGSASLTETTATGVGGALHRELLPMYRPQIR